MLSDTFPKICHICYQDTWMSDVTSVTELSSPGNSPPNSLGRRVYSVAFAWRNTAWNKGGNTRKSPRWYADCLMDMIYHKSASDPTCRFIIHLHGALPNLEELALASRQCFAQGRRFGGGRQDPGGVRFLICENTMPAMWPQASRLLSLIDHPSHSDTVIVADIHDDLAMQDKVVNDLEETLLTSKKTLALTFWKSNGNLASSFRSDSVPPAPVLTIDRSATMIDDDEHWNVDAGLAISRGGFRRTLQTMLGRNPYEHFLHKMGLLVNYDDQRGTDESLLKLFLLTRDADTIRLVRDHSVAFTHTLRTRKKDPPRRVEEEDRFPKYETQARRPLTFAYDEESRSTLRFRRLYWKRVR